MAVARRKFQVAVKPIMLKIISVDDEDDDIQRRNVSLKLKWEGELGGNKFSQMFQRRRDFTGERLISNRTVRWSDGGGGDRWFQNTCRFSSSSPWNLVFTISSGNSKAAKPCVIGSVAVNLAAIAEKTVKSSMEHTVPVSLMIDGVAKEASLTVLFNFIEIRLPQESTAISGEEGHGGDKPEKSRRRSMSQDESSLEVALDENTILRKSRSFVFSRIPLDSDKKESWFSWRNKRFISFKRAKTNEGNLDKITENSSGKDDTMNADIVSGSSDNLNSLQKDAPIDPSSDLNQQDDNSGGSWEERVLISRDGKTKLKANVFFASFDQRSDKAAGESACTALVAVISNWLHSNLDAMPSRLEFDNLIIQGSSDWRKLCENADYITHFPNKHFDIETVLSAGIRPISILQKKSFVGFFGAEKFESLKGAMSFDEIWKEISDNADNSVPSIYLVSWNDHFFVLKAEANAYYIIDTLGERLFEGCNQAYILKFDHSSTIEAIGDDEVPLKELEEEEKKKAASYFSLHHRLQIEFNYSCWSSSNPVSTVSSLFTSPD